MATTGSFDRWKKRTPISISYSWDVTKLEELPNLITKKLELILEKTGNDIKALAQFYVPVDQGAAKASIYLETEHSSGYETAVSEAQAAARFKESRWGHKGRSLEVFPEHSGDEEKVGRLKALIIVAVVYGIVLEEGMGGEDSLNVRATNPGARRPFVRPAMLEYEQKFFEAVGKVFEGIG